MAPVFRRQDDTGSVPGPTADSCGVKAATAGTKGQDCHYQSKAVLNLPRAKCDLWRGDAPRSESGLRENQIACDCQAQGAKHFFHKKANHRCRIKHPNAKQWLSRHWNILCLFCSYGDHVQHFKVLQDRCSQYYVWDELFSSLNELVDFYHSNSIAKERTVFLRDPEHFARVSKWLNK